MRLRACLALLIAFPALGASPAGDLLVAEGMQRAVESDLHWQVRDGTHPKMGPIKVAISLDAHITYIGTSKIVSTVYLSCEKRTRKIAIEVTTARSTDLASGLKSTQTPRLACLGVAGPGALPARSEIAATWEANELGDLLARGLSASALRACIGIEVSDSVVLPPAIGRDTQDITFEIPTYAPAPDEVFAACGETSAYPSSTQVASAPDASAPTPNTSPANVPKASAAATRPTPVARANPLPAPAPPEPRTASVLVPAPASAAASPPTSSWRHAHTLAKGRSNIRREPNISSVVVAQLPPAVRILVEEAVDDWWHVKSPSGAAYEGYIRRDRFTLD